jgi:hypothetical protein
VCIKIIFAGAVASDFLDDFKDTLLSSKLKKVHLLENDSNCSALEYSGRVLHGYLFVRFDASFRKIDETYTCLQNLSHTCNKASIDHSVNQGWKNVHQGGKALNSKKLYLVAQISNWVSVDNFNQNVHKLLSLKAMHLIFLCIG